MRRGEQAERFQVSAEINVTPMIDVMLVLLIIFMVVTPAVILLPKARTALPEPGRRVTLAVSREGAFTVQDGGRAQAVASANLAAGLARAYADRPGDHVLFLKADRGARYAHVLTALDAAREAGVRRVGMIAELPRGRNTH